VQVSELPVGEDESYSSMLLETLAEVIGSATAGKSYSDEELSELAVKVFEGSLPEIARITAQSLHRSKSELLADIEADRRVLQSQVRHDYSSAFANYEASSYLAYELGSICHDVYVDSGTADLLLPDPQVLFLLHGRACTVSSEVLHLLKGGFSDGANARHRTLHEIAVVMDLLAGANGRELAERYTAYATIERYQDMLSYQEHCNSIGYAPFSGEEVSELAAEHDAICELYGPNFSRQYQWAAPLFPPKTRITFKLLEEAANLAHKRPFYRYANHQIHAGPHAAMLNLHSKGMWSSIGVGARAGEKLGEIGHGALVHLLHCTANLIVAFGKAMDLNPDMTLGLQSLAILVEDTGKSFDRASARIPT
jgi:Family of unknown function (DUF5677)